MCARNCWYSYTVIEERRWRESDRPTERQADRQTYDIEIISNVFI